MYDVGLSGPLAPRAVADHAVVFITGRREIAPRIQLTVCNLWGQRRQNPHYIFMIFAVFDVTAIACRHYQAYKLIFCTFIDRYRSNQNNF